MARRRGHADLRVERSGVDLLRPLVELRTVLDRHADDPADHAHRVARGDVAHEVGTAARRDLVEERLDRRADELVVPALEL